MADSFSLKDHLFNADTLGDLAREYAAGIPGFPAQVFLDAVMPGLAARQLLERLDWIADCLTPHLASDFPTMADQLESAMPPPLDPTKTDDDFGRFIHAVPGIFAVRHGLTDAYRDRALDLIECATKRFSMESYIRPFLNTWPDIVMARLAQWAHHDHYHVRRLVSEGTRPNLPWAKRLTTDPFAALPLLDILHADPARFVTRSVANHLNDLSKRDGGRVMDRLAAWHAEGRQTKKELIWITRHALRTLIKQGDPRAMVMLGYRPDAPVSVETFDLHPNAPVIGQTARVSATLTASVPTPVLVDYVVWFKRPGGRESAKVHRLKQTQISPGQPLTISKNHTFKGDATTYTLVPGQHRMALQINGRILAETTFDLRPV